VVLGAGRLTALPDHADLIDTACPRSGSPLLMPTPNRRS